MGELLLSTTPPKPLVGRELTPVLREPLVWWRQRNIQPEGTLLTRPAPLVLLPAPKRELGFQEPRGSSGSGKACRFPGGVAAWCRWAAWRRPQGAWLGARRRLPQGAPTTRARLSGRRLRSRGLRSGHRGAVFEPVSSPRKLQGRLALRSRPPGQHPLVGGV